MSKTEQKVSNLMKVASKSDDPESLWQIAGQLERESAWDEAEQIRAKAREVERRMAEEAAR